jgi:hypothetical protein
VAIAFGTAGLAAVGTTSLAVPHPGSIAAGDLLVLAIANKYPNNGPATPNGWTLAGQVSGGQGAAGIDIGTVFSTVFTKVAVGNESGNLAVTLTSANSSIGRMFRYTKGAGAAWSVAAATGADNAGGATSWSVTATSNPGITAGDMMLACSAINIDSYTYASWAMSATGVTVWGTVAERQDSGTTQGQDCGLHVVEHPVTTGTASAAPVFTMTASASATSNPAGATVFLRLREVAPTPVAVSPVTIAGTSTVAVATRLGRLAQIAVATTSTVTAAFLRGLTAVIAIVSSTAAAFATRIAKLWAPTVASSTSVAVVSTVESEDQPDEPIASLPISVVFASSMSVATRLARNGAPTFSQGSTMSMTSSRQPPNVQAALASGRSSLGRKAGGGWRR